MSRRACWQPRHPLRRPPPISQRAIVACRVSDQREIGRLGAGPNCHYQRGVLPIWTIYRHPNDYPNDYVARMFETSPSTPTPSKFMVRSPEIHALRTTFIHAGLIALPREDGDDPNIVESWV